MATTYGEPFAQTPIGFGSADRIFASLGGKGRDGSSGEALREAGLFDLAAIGIGELRTAAITVNGLDRGLVPKSLATRPVAVSAMPLHASPATRRANN